ncbi:unnamed protein product [Rotaria socialis]|uniref:Uncharacterized protein n=2 Tax=Rotaria TaxID=231623 RepID=A0A820QM84_9BILA|nr:unnamed protein product [Rotaria socialis]CAF3331187.1 unnamed protein product [Rotaria socialis]CAF3331536.1 unnamed protein product [Rotaria socialis]CAF4422404.1 unnamed protein product [Rotaria socialis]CAF4463029.1 unnamed protein product [Rotaria socialis]
MVIEKISFTEKKKKTIFGRLTNKFINQQRCSKRDQSVQTSSHSSITTTVLKQQIYSSDNQSANSEISSRRRRSSFKSFLMLYSPKPIPLIHRTARRRSINLTASKRLSSECLQVALIRKIQPLNRFDSSSMFSSSSKQMYNDETSSRDERLSIGPMKWSTPNRTMIYKTSSPNNNNSDRQHRFGTVDQLSFSNIFDRSD